MNISAMSQYSDDDDDDEGGLEDFLGDLGISLT